MKKYVFILIGVLVYLITPHDSDAQIWKNMGKKIEKKVEQQADRRLERKIDKTIDQGFDKVEEAADKKPQKKEKSSDEKADKKKSSDNDTNETDYSSIFEALGNMEEGEDGMPFDPSSILKSMGLGGDVPAPEAKYTFKMSVEYEVKGDKDEGTKMTLMLSDKGYLGMNTPMQQNVFMIMDNGITHTFMTEDKSFMSMDMTALSGWMMNEMEEEAADEDVKIKKLGNETLLGYRCDIYEFESSDNISRISFATQLPVTDFFENFSAMNKDSKIPKNAPTSGLPLKIVTIEKATKEVHQLVATKVDNKKVDFDTTGYKSKF